MVRGLRVVFSPNPVSHVLYSYRVPEPGARGTVTAARVAGGLRTYLEVPAAAWSTSNGTATAWCAASLCGT